MTVERMEEELRNDEELCKIMKLALNANPEDVRVIANYLLKKSRHRQNLENRV